MVLTALSSAQLERLVQLITEKEALQARLDQVNHSLEAFEKGDTFSQSKARPWVRGRHRRGGLKDRLLKLLGAVGKAGMTVKELAEKSGAKYSSVSVWFYTTGKKIKGIKKVGKAKFAYISG
jgi:hypothetical protein